MKFLHAADIHLDSPLAGLARRSDVPPEIVRDCTRRAFARLIDLAIAEDVAFVIIAGDLYDQDWKDYSTGLFFALQMQRLKRPCILVRGNHDARSVITRKLQPPANVQEFSSRVAHSIPLHECGVALHGRSFPERAVPEDLSASYPDRAKGMLNIGVLHTSADDPGGTHDTYAPCSVAALQMKGYDYWALGHIHDRRVLSGAPWIIFPGNLQGRHPNETGAKGCTIVEVQDRQIVGTPEHHTLDVLRWAAPVADLDGVEDIAQLADRVREKLEAAVGNADGRPVIARLRLVGATKLHAQFCADSEAIEAECRNVAIGVADNLYLEAVRCRTRAPSAAGGGEDALAMLQAAFDDALDDPALAARLLADFNSLSGQIPRSARATESDVPRDAEQLRALLPDAWQAVAHALAGGSGE